MTWLRGFLILLLLHFLPVESQSQRFRKVKKEVDYPDFQQKQQQQKEIHDDYFLKKDPPRQPRGDETDQSIQAAGGTQTKEEGTHEPGMPYNFTYKVQDKETQFSQKVDSDGEVVTGEYRVLLPDGRTQIVTYIADWKNGYKAKVRYEGTFRPYIPPPRPASGDENEGNVLPGGFPPKPTPRPQTCPPGHFRRPGESRCRAFQEQVVDSQGLRPQPHIPNEGEQEVLPGGYLPEENPCDQRQNSKTSWNSRCGTTVDEEEGNVQPGGYLPRPMTPCTPAYMGYPSKGYGNCHELAVAPVKDPARRQTRAPFPSQSIPEPGEEEGSSLPGFDPTTPKPCPQGYFYSPARRQCRPGSYILKLAEDKNKCIAERKDPRTCFPDLCFPGSPHPRCQRRRLKSTTTTSIPPVVDENEEDIQAAGLTLPPPPSKPANLYGTPDMPFGVRLNRKFGYDF